ncbi:MAG: methyltransferase [Desulfobacteraceae bacterium]|nr:methyltransferase [Desulfobacteraceae bacterium]
MTPLSDIEADKNDILNILYQSEVKLTPQIFIKEIKSKFSLSSIEAKNVLHNLIYEQELSYHYLYGSTYIEQSFLKPVRVSNHFILKPPGFQSPVNQNNPNNIELIIELIIDQGISFGSGQHPTTQLCLQAIDYCFFDERMMSTKQQLIGADIGTGSGVLALAMCKAGIGSCNAYEIDPVSINEAKKNVALNHLAHKIVVVEDTIKESKNKYSILCANLRFPTLKSLSGLIFESLKKEGIAIISGVREWEKEKLINTYSKMGFKLCRQQDLKKWSAFVLVKKVC